MVSQRELWKLDRGCRGAILQVRPSCGDNCWYITGSVTHDFHDSSISGATASLIGSRKRTRIAFLAGEVVGLTNNISMTSSLSIADIERNRGDSSTY